MGRYVIDVGVLLRLVADELEIASEHELLAPTLIRSQALSTLHEAVHSGAIDGATGRERIRRVNATKLRLLGDAVLRRRAWEIADELGWAETYDAEYLALTQLQADAFVTLDPKLAAAARAVVPVAAIDDLTRGAPPLS